MKNPDSSHPTPLRSNVELHATVPPIAEKPQAVHQVLRDISVIRPLTELELTDSEALSRRADALFDSGVFTARTEAQHFTELIARRTRGEPLAASLEMYLTQVELTIAQLAKVENLRSEAFTDQEQQDQARRQVQGLQRDLAGRRVQLAELKEFAAGMRPGSLSHPQAEIRFLIDMGQHRLGVLEALRFLDKEEIPSLEKQLAAAEARLAALTPKPASA